MRLADYSLHSYALRYERPVKWSDIVEEAAPFVLLRLQDDTGAVGVAEITVKPTWCGVTTRSLIAAIEEIFVPLLRTIELDDPVVVRRALDRIPENQAAKTLVDNACWDLHAARTGQSLRAMWGGARSVELSFALTRQAPPAMASEAATMIARHGFRTLKVKGGQGIATDCAVMREVRAAVGDAVRLYVDANGAYAASEATEYSRAMHDAGALFVEDPCPLAPDAQFSRMQGALAAPLLVDFGCASARDARLFIEHGAQALSIKPGRFGLSDSRAMQQFAAAAGCTPVVGLMGESLLGTFAGLSFAAALENAVLPAELSWYLAMTNQIVTVAPKIVAGVLELPEAAALSELVDWAAVERFRT
jgi:L-alanine-DL-glutamate epimerase-like enolase superfamily enzyme